MTAVPVLYFCTTARVLSFLLYDYDTRRFRLLVLLCRQAKGPSLQVLFFVSERNRNIAVCPEYHHITIAKEANRP